MNNDPRMPRDARPSDISDAEADVSAWFGHLERVEAPAGLRRRVLDAGASEAAPAGAGKLLRFPLGAWGIASAALVLLALGAAFTVELLDPVAAPVPAAAERPADGGLLPVREDESLALYHGVEVFDEVGLAPGDVIADWSR